VKCTAHVASNTFERTKTLLVSTFARVEDGAAFRTERTWFVVRRDANNFVGNYRFVANVFTSRTGLAYEQIRHETARISLCQLSPPHQLRTAIIKSSPVDRPEKKNKHTRSSADNRPFIFRPVNVREALVSLSDLRRLCILRAQLITAELVSFV